MDAACYLESRGGEVSFKNLDVSRLIPSAHDTANPSLHVMRPQERHLAARLVSEWERARNAGGEPIF
ncbi:MAG TPA: hypothetical protein PLS81_07975 [Deltaproteobacteria bacterium]|nr:hypothetical protein [Deltaproteobacteria bacterium]